MFFTTVTYFVLAFLEISDRFLFSALSGVLFAGLLFMALDILEKHSDAMYAKVEKTIESPVLLKIGGNFDLGHEVRNGRIYFCEYEIVFVSLDKKPHMMEKLPAKLIERYTTDGVTTLHIRTYDRREYRIRTSEVHDFLALFDTHYKN